VLVKLTSLRTCKYTLLTSYFSWTTSYEVTSLATCMGWGGVGWAINILSTLLTASRRSKTDSETNGDSETKIQKLFPPIQKPSRFRTYRDSATIATVCRNYHDS
jgi:hypothetical protein